MCSAFRYLFILLSLVSVSCQQLPAVEKNETKQPKQTLKVVWEAPEKIVKGGYPRVHRLNDGRLMMCYSASANDYIKFSDDNGLTWSEDAQVVMKHLVVENEAGKAKVHAANPEFALREDLEHIQTAVNALNKLTDGGVHFSLNSENYSGTPFHKVENVIQHTFTGKHPAGNVGVQIHHISPIRKGETVWTVSLLMLAAIGKLFNTGKYDLKRKVAVTGPKAINPAYVEAYPGMAIKDVQEFYNASENLRFVSGDVLTGTNVGANGFLGFFDNQVTILEEGDKYELFGWAKPFRPSLFSASRTYFSWLTPNKKYDMDTNLHGGPRAFVVNDVYSKVLPMNLYPVYLLKACLANDIDKMEKFGIYEVLEEDLALCEYVCPSKIYIQQIITEGIALMLKEMC